MFFGYRFLVLQPAILAAFGVYGQSDVQDRVLRRDFLGQVTESCLGSRNARIQDLTERIYGANTHVFEGPYSSEQICFLLDESENIFAKANALQRTVTVSRGMEVILGDDELSMILCHELAHITLQHVEWQTTHPDLLKVDVWQDQKNRVQSAHGKLDLTAMAEKFAEQTRLKLEIEEKIEERPKLKADLVALQDRFSRDQDWQGYLRALSALAEECCVQLSQELRDNLVWQSEQDHLMELWNLEQQKLKNLEDTLLGDKGAHANWREQEADEVGTVICQNAGLQKKSFAQAILKTKDDKDPTPEQCWQNLVGYSNGDNQDLLQVKRGDKVHPHSCWRMQNILLNL